MSTVAAEPTAKETPKVENPTQPQPEAKAKEVSFSDFLDKELGDSAPEKTPSAKVADTKPAETTQEKVEKTPSAATDGKETAKSSEPKTPDSLLDKLKNTIVEDVKAQEKPKTEEASATSKDDIEEALPEGTSASAQTAFAKLTRELKEARGKLKEMEGKIAARTEVVENKGGNVETDSQLKDLQAKLEKLASEREELEGELRVSKVEATREFKAVVAEPTKAAVQTISDIAKIYEVRPNAIVEASYEPDGAKRRAILKELTSEMDAVDALQVRTKVEELVQLNAKRDSMIKESKSVLEAMAKAEEEKEAAERSRYDQEAKKAFGEVWENFQKNVPILQKVEGNDEWNKTIDTLRIQAEKLDSEPLDHRQRAALTYQAVALPVLVQVFKDYVSRTTQETNSLRQSLDEYRKATPGAGSGQAPEKSAGLDKSVSFLDAVTR